MAYFVNNCYISDLKLLTSVLAADGEDGNMVQLGKLRLTVVKLFPRILKKIDFNSCGLIVFSLRIKVISSFRCFKIMF